MSLFLESLKFCLHLCKSFVQFLTGCSLVSAWANAQALVHWLLCSIRPCSNLGLQLAAGLVVCTTSNHSAAHVLAWSFSLGKGGFLVDFVPLLRQTRVHGTERSVQILGASLSNQALLLFISSSLCSRSLVVSLLNCSQLALVFTDSASTSDTPLGSKRKDNWLLRLDSLTGIVWASRFQAGHHSVFLLLLLIFFL